MGINTTYSKTRQEIAREYGISRRTLFRWLKREEIELPRGLVSPKNQSRIYEVFGVPCSFRQPVVAKDEIAAELSPDCPKMAQEVPEKMIYSAYFCENI